MPKTVLESVDEHLTRLLEGSDRKMVEIVPTGKRTKIDVRAGEEDEPSIVVSIVEEESIVE